MDKTPSAPEPQPPLSPAMLARAPHRLLFFIGAANVLLAMFWWTLWLVEARWHVLDLPQPQVYGGWLHAIVMQYHVLAPFMFGFLLTVFPRWMGQDDLTVWHYVPVGLGLFGGQLLTLGGALGPAHLLHLGAVFTLVGWGTGLFYLLRMLWRDGGKTWHAVSCAAGLFLGFVGLLAYAGFLHVDDARLMFAAIKIGTFGLLLPVYFTVCHRMVPFFSGNVAGAGYRLFRPGWSLPLVWLLSLAHLALELGHRQDWLWLADVPLAALFAVHAIAWQPWKCLRPGLLAALHLAFAWLPLAFALYALQSLLGSRWSSSPDCLTVFKAPAERHNPRNGNQQRQDQPGPLEHPSFSPRSRHDRILLRWCSRVVPMAAPVLRGWL